MRQIPQIVQITQSHNQPEVVDPYQAVLDAWNASDFAQRLKPGKTVGIGVGSRGIANIEKMVKATIDFVQKRGGIPFVVASMGSHGGANAEGQRELLAEYGISESALGVPVKTDMAVEVIGTNSWGEPVYWDKNAFQADHVVTLSRVKPHTDFRGKYESGIVKMLVIGLGKREGASQHHLWGIAGLRDMMPKTVEVILEKSPFEAGLAIVENARENTALVEIVDKAKLLKREPEILDLARAWMARLPFDQCDLLIVGEVGKNYSGAGIDPNVVGRLLMETVTEEFKPCITRICALDLSPESHGNATGVGIADLTTDHFLAKIDPIPFRMNNLTARFLWRSKLPLSFPTDKDCILAGLESCWRPRWNEIRMAIIPNSLELENIWISPALWEDIKTRPEVKKQGEFVDFGFDPKGNLNQMQLFPHAHCSKRAKH
ncbi:MAG: lactate racemase domain-containing protein [Gemmataceae bacterium]